jgi:hypothetical protein
MKLIDCEWNKCTNKHIHTWLANDESGITADFDSECSEGSVIIVISTSSTWMKNAQGKWQKVGSMEVKA